MGSLEGVESIENPVMIPPYKDEVFPAVESVVLQYIQDKGSCKLPNSQSEWGLDLGPYLSLHLIKKESRLIRISYI